ncbi:MAG: serine hydrolase domain-containing protein [Methyloceanibacter sp.]
MALKRKLGLPCLLSILFLGCIAPAHAAEPADIESDLAITIDGRTRNAGIEEAMKLLNVPSVSLALIDEDRIALARAYGAGATPDTLYQAASLSKFVTAVGAMRLIEAGQITLDEDVNAKLTSWRVPDNAFEKDHAVTLRGLLSMTGGIGVPGFAGYAAGAPLPTLTQILDGTPPANSPPVTVIAVPGSAYHYSGGGYEIVEALVSDIAHVPYPEVMDDLVLEAAGMRHSTFTQPLPQHLAGQAAVGHFRDGQEIPGRWRVVPEHAAGGLWSTPSDLANLLILMGRAWRGESRLFLAPETVREMLTRQNGGPYGLGAALAEEDGATLVMKRGQNVGYQSYLVLLPASGQGLVVMTNSDNGSILAEALIRRAAVLYDWLLPVILPD